MPLANENFFELEKYSAIMISQLWKDIKDIEFVKQSIRHQRIDTNSFYVKKLSNQERQEHTLK